jgi:RNase adaptor protein for sRNA GlmZ degradation
MPKFMHKTGLDRAVQAFLNGLPESRNFYTWVKALVGQHVKDFCKRGFEHVQVCFGCTGGQHRSVYFAQKLARDFKKRAGLKVKLRHISLEQKGLLK